MNNMPIRFVFPEDFNAMFRKEYAVSGNKFTVEVQELGIAPKTATGAQLCFHWAFRILVNGNNIVEGPYYWGVDKRRLSMENVSNHLASYWVHSKEVEEAQGLAENNDEAVIDTVAFKCADWMHQYMMQPEGMRDFEILGKFMDGNGWEIRLSPNYNSAYIFEFMQQTGEKKVHVSIYTLDRQTAVEL